MTLADLFNGSLDGTPTHVTDGSSTQVREGETVLHRILVGEAPEADVTISLYNGEDDTYLVTTIVVPAALSYPAIPVGLSFPDGLYVEFTSAVDVTLIHTP
jgi:hypothetical protein